MTIALSSCLLTCQAPQEAATAAATAATAEAALADSSRQGITGSSGRSRGSAGEDDESEDDEGAGPDRLRAAREAAVKAAAYGDGVLNEGKYRCGRMCVAHAPGTFTCVPDHMFACVCVCVCASVFVCLCAVCCA